MAVEKAKTPKTKSTIKKARKSSVADDDDDIFSNFMVDEDEKVRVKVSDELRKVNKKGLNE